MYGCIYVLVWYMHVCIWVFCLAPWKNLSMRVLYSATMLWNDWTSTPCGPGWPTKHYRVLCKKLSHEKLMLLLKLQHQISLASTSGRPAHVVILFWLKMLTQLQNWNKERYYFAVHFLWLLGRLKLSPKYFLTTSDIYGHITNKRLKCSWDNCNPEHPEPLKHVNTLR